MPFSRDHHAGLLFCWKIKEGLKKGASFDRIANYVRFFWEEHLREHFQEEEILLFNQQDTELARRGKAEHVALESLFLAAIEGRLARPDCLPFAEQLTAHIRFEEREFFPFMENNLPPQVLSAISDILIRLHTRPFEDNYPDEFWIK
ncbi:hemerythrin domain-containing protein [Mucilaginibacter terrenus]|uniref:hemerythrin domain-containing protein n=1 Tax=Mucilaginibacter terrenus TaxID=2482727 RepID=UPI001401D312|nr:hemerythrin domain-containing protein [Mucilaginibacter terrenus]